MTRKRDEPNSEKIRNIFYFFEFSKNVNRFGIFIHSIGMVLTLVLLIQLLLFSFQFQIFISILLIILSIGVLVCLIIYIIFWLKVRKFRKTNNVENVFKSFKEGDKERINEKIKKVFKRFKISRIQIQLANLFDLIMFLSFLSLIFFIFIYWQTLFINSIIINGKNVSFNFSYVIFLFVSSLFNYSLMFIQILRYSTFKPIRSLRENLRKEFNSLLIDLDISIEGILDRPLVDFSFCIESKKEKELHEILQEWKALYSGTYFRGLRKEIYFPNYHVILFSYSSENFYFELFKNLRSKLQDLILYKNLGKEIEISNKLIHNYRKILDNYLELINFNIQRIDSNRNRKLEIVKIISIIVGIILTPISIIISILNLGIFI